MIELSSGRIFNPADCHLDIEEIAHSLSMQCRFTGSVRHFYSVAEHSIIVSLLMEEFKMGDPLEGLLHDAIETAVGDMASPWKPVLDWRSFEYPLDQTYRESVGLPSEKTEGCHEADQLVGFIEAILLMPSKAERWFDPDGLRDRAQALIDQGWRTLNLYPPEAKAAFLKRFDVLAP